MKKILLLPILACATLLTGASLSSAQTAAPAAPPAVTPATDATASPTPAMKKTRKKKDTTMATPADGTSAPKKEAFKGRDTPAPGGGPGMVWVNTKSKVYHMPASKWYGRTKDGKYMTEDEAKAMGAHADPSKGKSAKS